MGSKNWIENMHMKKGAERNSAKKAGVSTGEYAEKNDKKPGKAGRRARLAETLMSINKGKK